MTKEQWLNAWIPGRGAGKGKDRLDALLAWLRAHPSYPSMPSRLEIQQKIEELAREKI